MNIYIIYRISTCDIIDYYEDAEVCGEVYWDLKETAQYRGDIAWCRVNLETVARLDKFEKSRQKNNFSSVGS